MKSSLSSLQKSMKMPSNRTPKAKSNHPSHSKLPAYPEPTTVVKKKRRVSLLLWAWLRRWVRFLMRSVVVLLNKRRRLRSRQARSRPNSANRLGSTTARTHRRLHSSSPRSATCSSLSVATANLLKISTGSCHQVKRVARRTLATVSLRKTCKS